ncbi:hypothetical protein FOL47_010503 [Perkinsus chesapeaki]|uniref:Uncharacterized protein n=1 Tax=Perkinsus chesapeaki TaxID=330153 RepID=A0A7J6L1Y9_PERCH|nr:hypothetical protein FOL47_010503 [Perkinsus chesapeaki]
MIGECEKRGKYADDVELKFQIQEDATEELRDRLAELESDFATWSRTPSSSTVEAVGLPELGAMVEGLELIKNTVAKLSRRRDQDFAETKSQFQSLDLRLSHVEQQCCCCQSATSVTGEACPVIEACKKLQSEIRDVAKLKIPDIEARMANHLNNTAELVGNFRSEMKQLRTDLDQVIESSGHRDATFKTIVELGQQTQKLQTRRESQLSTVESEIEFLKGEIRAVTERLMQPCEVSEAVDLLRAELRNRVERITREHRQDNLELRSQLRNLADLRDRVTILSDKHLQLAERLEEDQSGQESLISEMKGGVTGNDFWRQTEGPKRETNVIETCMTPLPNTDAATGGGTSFEKVSQCVPALCGKVDDHREPGDDLVEAQTLDAISPIEPSHDIPTSESIGSITVSATDEASTVLWALECGSLNLEEISTSPVFSIFGGAFYFIVAVDASEKITLSLKAIRYAQELSGDFFVVHPVSGDVIASRPIPNVASVSHGSSVPLCGIEDVGSEGNATVLIGARMRILET